MDEITKTCGLYSDGVCRETICVAEGFSICCADCDINDECKRACSVWKNLG
jgi:hypothetical protein